MLRPAIVHEPGRRSGRGRPAALLAVLALTLPALAVVTAGPAHATGCDITAVTPSSGPAAGGTPVTITGDGFTNPLCASFMTIGGVSVSFTVVNDTTITTTTPGGTGPADITVYSVDVLPTFTLSGGFTYTSSLFPFTGFNSPVDNPPTINQAHAGQAIPMKWGLGGDQGLNILAAGSPTATQVDCASGAPVNTATLTDTAGGSGLQDDAGNYTYVWKTSKAWAGTCQQFTLTLTDGSSHTAIFQFS